MAGVTFERIEGSDEAVVGLHAVVSAYQEVYAEPPYCEGPRDAAGFLVRARRQATRDGFRLVLAREGDEVVGFAFGYWLPHGHHVVERPAGAARSALRRGGRPHGPSTWPNSRYAEDGDGRVSPPRCTGS